MRLFLQVVNAKTFAMEVEPSALVEEVKEKVGEREGVSMEQLVLRFRGKELRNGGTLVDSGVAAEDTVVVGGVLRGGMLVKVKTLTGKEIEIDIEPTDKIERIKERVEEKEGIPPPQQRLIFGGKQMADDKTAKDFNIEGGSVLHLVLALRGGC